MDEPLTISFELKPSGLEISAYTPMSSEPITVSRGTECFNLIHEMSQAYQLLAVRQSFAEKGDRGVISDLQRLGEQIYSLFFMGLEDCLKTASSVFLEHGVFLLPLELAFDGEQFIGHRYPIGNWTRGLGAMPQRTDIGFRSHWTAEPKALFLGHTDTEVFDSFRGHGKMTICESMERTTWEMLDRRLFDNPYSMLHFSGHGWYPESSPSESYLVIDETQVGPSNLGLLDPKAIRFSGMNQPLVFVNACYSGRVTGSYQGYVGMAENFVRSGASSCVTTLWSISDDSASRFAGQFYSHLLDRRTVGEALREARIYSWRNEDDLLTGLSYTLFGNPESLVQI